MKAAGAIELGESKSTSSTPKIGGVNRGASILDFILRIIAFLGTLVSAIAMGTTRERLPFFTQFLQFRAEYDDLPTFTFFVVANSVVCGYLVFSLALSIFHIIRSNAKRSRIILIFFDTAMLALLTAGASAAAAIVYLAHKGNAKANWFAICQQFNSFCERISGSLIGSFSLLISGFSYLLLVDYDEFEETAPKGLFPPEPEHYRGPKQLELGLQAWQQHLSFWIKATRWIYMSQGLSLVEKWAPLLINVETTLKWDPMFSLVATVGADENLLVKDHTHTFVTKGVTLVTYDKARNAVALALSPVVRALVDPDGALRDVRNLDSHLLIRKITTLRDKVHSPIMENMCIIVITFFNLRCVLTLVDPHIPLPNEEIIARVTKQVLALFTSSQGLEVTWSSVVKIWQSLYREAHGKDPFRPDQKRPVKNLFLAGSYTKQVYATDFAIEEE
ncbi:PREDICTED: casparian strip [Prunus dulcis]|uniref:CASP-like protein n=1 Tax=Prunus dulcis TaxID=3755 RepID=A0A5E4EX92_PRUDU|nr:PREDICTED: casparian strip [Prunus dulcis]